jgi:hypothetical protein
MKCSKHKRYEAKRRPTVPCYQCWAKYALENKGAKFTSPEMLRMGEAAVLFEDEMIMGKKQVDKPERTGYSIKRKDRT